MVVAWLGPAASESHDAIEKLSNISSIPHDYDTLAEVISDMAKRVEGGLSTRYGLFGLAFVLQFLRRPSFQRAWVMQEICLPQEVIFLCGSNDITLLDLSTVLHCLTLFAQVYKRCSFRPLEMMAQLILTRLNPTALQLSTELNSVNRCPRRTSCEQQTAVFFKKILFRLLTREIVSMRFWGSQVILKSFLYDKIIKSHAISYALNSPMLYS